MKEIKKYEENNMTFEDIAIDWLEKKKVRIKPSTYNKYKQLLLKHILLQFGTLKPFQYSIEIFEAGMFSITYSNSKSLSRSTVKSILYLIRAIIKYGLRYGLNGNIEFEFDINGDDSKEYAVLTKKDEKSLMNYIYENPSMSNLGIMLSLTTGLRIGEICALRKKNINFDSNIIYICETAQRLQIKGGTKLITTSPKSKKAFRYVPLPQITASYLKSFDFQNMEEDFFIMTNATTPFEPRTLQYSFKSTLKKCNINDINFHSLRHTFATNCVELGFDIKTLSELLGHSNVSFTLNRYVHSSINQKIQQMRLIDSCYKEIS